MATVIADALRDRYVLERELGRGGMATVYAPRLEKTIGKGLTPHFGGSREGRAVR